MTINSKCRLILDRFSQQPTLTSAKRCIRELVRAIGPGFHPDTRMSDYIYVHNPAQRIFSAGEAEQLQKQFDTAIAALDSSNIDPCAIALPIQRKLLRRGH